MRLVDKTQLKEQQSKQNAKKIDDLKEMLSLVEKEVERMTRIQKEELRKQRKLKRDLNFVC